MFLLLFWISFILAGTHLYNDFTWWYWVVIIVFGLVEARTNWEKSNK